MPLCFWAADATAPCAQAEVVCRQLGFHTPEVAVFDDATESCKAGLQPSFNRASRQAACTAGFTPGRPGSCGGLQSGACTYSPPTCEVDHSFRKVRGLPGRWGARSVSHSKSTLCDGLMWARRAPCAPF